MTELLQVSVQQYLDQLASKQPTPGGGSAAALAGAMGAALLCMSAEFTVGRERYVAYQESAQSVLTAATRLLIDLQQLVEEDATAYALFGTALMLPKTTEAEQASRHQALQDATRSATIVPLKIAKNCYQLLELAGMMASNCNPNLVSDVAVAVHLSLSAFHGAVLNVNLNLKSLEDTVLVAEVQQQLQPMQEAAPQLANLALTTSYHVMKLSK